MPFLRSFFLAFAGMKARLGHCQMSRAICVYSQKGGAGKTTTVVNLAAALALLGRRTLLIDMNPHENAAPMASVLSRRYRFSLRDVIRGRVPIERAIIPSCLHCLKVLPSPVNASLDDRMHLGRLDMPGFLRDALARVRDDYEYILIDTPASDWSYISHAASASDYMLVILRADVLSFRSFGKSLDIIQTIKRRFNPLLKLAGIALTMYDPEEEGCVTMPTDSLRDRPRWLFRTLIPKDRAIASSAIAGKPLVVSDYDSKGARSFRFLADELIERIG
jgi:chromosome partitioning protein